VTPLQLPVDPFQVRIPSWVKHLVTPLTADSSRFQKIGEEQVSHLCDEQKPAPLPSTRCHYLGTKI